MLVSLHATICIGAAMCQETHDKISSSLGIEFDVSGRDELEYEAIVLGMYIYYSCAGHIVAPNGREYDQHIQLEIMDDTTAYTRDFDTHVDLSTSLSRLINMKAGYYCWPLEGGKDR